MAEDIKDISTRGAIMAIAVSLIVLAGVTTFGVFGDYGGGTPDNDRYQAVTLNNGATFYGQLSGLGNKYVTLDNAYTIQNAAGQGQDGKQATPQLSLVARDKALYQPVGAMKIHSEQIAVWEELSEDSPVTKAINEQNKEEKK
ncbi:MAG TPA: hypothetical protein VIF43_03935 [Patescibacteria group bacterium]|jgi:hypothetical protein